MKVLKPIVPRISKSHYIETITSWINIMIELVVPTVELKEKALAYRQEHFDFGK